jgi:hypothetical protein
MTFAWTVAVFVSIRIAIHARQQLREIRDRLRFQLMMELADVCRVSGPQVGNSCFPAPKPSTSSRNIEESPIDT